MFSEKITENSTILGMNDREVFASKKGDDINERRK